MSTAHEGSLSLASMFGQAEIFITHRLWIISPSELMTALIRSIFPFFNFLAIGQIPSLSGGGHPINMFSSLDSLLSRSRDHVASQSSSLNSSPILSLISAIFRSLIQLDQTLAGTSLRAATIQQQKNNKDNRETLLMHSATNNFNQTNVILVCPSPPMLLSHASADE